MSFLREKQSRRFLLYIILLSILMSGFGYLYCIRQTRMAKEMLLQHDSAVAGSLLEQGIAPDIIARAISNTNESDRGNELLQKLGFTEKTEARFFPAIAMFKSNTIQDMLTGIALFTGILITLCLAFLAKREQLYREANKVILKYTEGDFNTHLPRTDTGTLSQLFASIDKLATALQAKSEVEHQTKEFLKNTISDISHQLKTPLTALNMYNEIITNEPGNTATITKYSQKTNIALGRMEQLIQSFLKITRLDAGSIVFEKTPHFISDLVKQATEELTTRATCEKKAIIVHGKKEEQLMCDWQWTSEAIGNIVKNALDHTAAGGHVHISWERSPAMVRISIADDGTGIAPEDFHHIFKRFYRSKNSMDSQGAGLGLPLAKSIIEGQGGVLSVQSTPNAGTTFIISFLTES